MPELGSLESVRGALRNERPYRELNRYAVECQRPRNPEQAYKPRDDKKSDDCPAHEPRQLPFILESIAEDRPSLNSRHRAWRETALLTAKSPAAGPEAGQSPFGSGVNGRSSGPRKSGNRKADNEHKEEQYAPPCPQPLTASEDFGRQRSIAGRNGVGHAHSTRWRYRR